jgi:3-oxoacyl-[acyl-carrier-protein] synthase III
MTSTAQTSNATSTPYPPPPPPPPFGAHVVGTGSHLPERRLTNEELAKLVDTNDEWIVQRTGIRERRIAAATESTADLATHAGRRAIEDAGLEAKDISLVIVATCTPEMVFPSTACITAARLGCGNAGAFDLMAACSGFVYALHTGAAFVRSGLHRHVLVIGAETLSKVVDYKDRGSCILFGDGAGAVVLSQSPDARKGFVYGQLFSDGGPMSDAMLLKPGSRHPITQELLDSGDHFMKLKGREVYKFAVSKFEELIRDAMQRCELNKQSLSLIVPHQVNQRIIDSAMEKLELGPEKVFVNIDRYGNTSSASIPIALDEARKAGRVKPGDNVVFVAFGAGLTWGNAVVKF